MLHEDIITAKIVDILETMRSAWNIDPQNTQTFLGESQRPDLTVRERGREPIVIEVKIDEPNAPNLSGEAQAREHLGRQLVSYERVTTAMALRLPHRFRHFSHRELEDALRHADDLHYVLLSGDVPEGIHRFPNEGWIKGNLTDIATAIRIGAIPISKVANAAYDLEHGVNETSILYLSFSQNGLLSVYFYLMLCLMRNYMTMFGPCGVILHWDYCATGCIVTSNTQDVVGFLSRV